VESKSPAPHNERGASGADEGIRLNCRSQSFVIVRYFLTFEWAQTLRTRADGSGPRVVANRVANAAPHRAFLAGGIVIQFARTDPSLRFRVTLQIVP
jgi:hypothetical protein